MTQKQTNSAKQLVSGGKTKEKQDSEEIFKTATPAADKIEDIYIAVTGITGAGKSEFIGLCTGSNVVVGDGLTSCTTQVEDWIFMYNETLRVHLIDTPGFDDTTKKDVEVLRDIAGWLCVTYKKSILLSGLIYLHPISDNRLRGSALRNLYMVKKLCGRDCLPGIVLATTMWGLVDPQAGLKRESQLRSTDDFWGEMEKGGSLVLRHERTKESALAILEAIIRRRHPMILKIQDEMINEKKGLENTGAGIKVNEDLIEADLKHKKELATLRDEMKKADEASRKEIKELMRKQQEEIDENKRQREDLEASMKDLEEERAKDLKKLQDQLTQQANHLEAKEKEINEFRESLAERARAHTLHKEEQRRLQIRLEEMERDRSKEVEALKRSIQQAERQSTGLWSSMSDWISKTLGHLFGWRHEQAHVSVP